MFTGIVTERGKVLAVTNQATGSRLRIAANTVLEDASTDDSIAVNGCCLTVVERGSDWWEADVMTETLKCTSLGALTAGDDVNLERPVRIGARLDGHIVQGHIDGTAEIVEIAVAEDGSRQMTFLLPEGLAKYVVPKGSITLDGVSLTVAAMHDRLGMVSLIPHTQSITTLAAREIGDRLNVEVDVLAKYVESLLQHPED